MHTNKYLLVFRFAYRSANWYCYWYAMGPEFVSGQCMCIQYIEFCLLFAKQCVTFICITCSNMNYMPLSINYSSHTQELFRTYTYWLFVSTIYSSKLKKIEHLFNIIAFKNSINFGIVWRSNRWMAADGIMHTHRTHIPIVHFQWSMVAFNFLDFTLI